MCHQLSLLRQDQEEWHDASDQPLPTDDVVMLSQETSASVESLMDVEEIDPIQTALDDTNEVPVTMSMIKAAYIYCSVVAVSNKVSF